MPHGQRRPFSVENRSDRRPIKPAAWNHQNDLKELVGKRVRLALLNGQVPEGTLVAADQFTLKLSIGGRVTVYFKSATISFGEVGAA